MRIISMKQKNQEQEENTQCAAMQKAIAFALIRPGNISDSRRLGTGPAPKENAKTYLT